MHCTFHSGPLDGWEHNCPRAVIGEEWMVGLSRIEDDPDPLFCMFEEVMPRSFSIVCPIARYQLVAQGVMRFKGMLTNTNNPTRRSI